MATSVLNISRAVNASFSLGTLSADLNASSSSTENASATSVALSAVDTSYGVVATTVLVIAFSVIILAIVVGNCVVIVAVVCETSLRCVTNYYIVSLSVADLLVGIVVLPFSATYEILGDWVFGSALCVFWTAFDVLVCTASICNLVVISLDRYLAISRPMSYHKWNTKRCAAMMITCVWVLATVICITPLFGFGVREQGIRNQCLLTGGVGYVIFSAAGSFFVPLCGILFMYYRIYVLAGYHTRRIRNERKYMKEISSYYSAQETLGVPGTPRAQTNGGAQRSRGSPHVGDAHRKSRATFRESRTNRLTAPVRIRVTSEANAPAEFPTTDDNSSDESGKHKSSEIARRVAHVKNSIRHFSKEKRAAKTLAIVVGCFVVCWLPFFTVYIVEGVCASCRVPTLAFKFVFWLGYVNSCLNPVIYPCSNREFRRAFKKLLKRVGRKLVETKQDYYWYVNSTPSPSPRDKRCRTAGAGINNVGSTRRNYVCGDRRVLVAPLTRSVSFQTLSATAPLQAYLSVATSARLHLSHADFLTTSFTSPPPRADAAPTATEYAAPITRSCSQLVVRQVVADGDLNIARTNTADRRQEDVELADDDTVVREGTAQCQRRSSGRAFYSRETNVTSRL